MLHVFTILLVAMVNPAAAAYTNAEYGYVVKLPRDAHLERTSPPSPQHGVGIRTDPTSGIVVWVDGSYDSTFLGSVEAIARQRRALISDSGADVVSFDATPTRLGGLTALKVTVIFRGVGEREATCEAHIIALRPGRSGGPAIIYDVSARAPAFQKEEAMAALDRIAAGWKTASLK